MKLVVLCLIGMILAGTLAGCGKKGSPQAPGESAYPGSYPAPR